MAKKRKSDVPQPAVMDEDWRAHSDADALMRAEEVKGDRSRHSAAQKHLRTKAKHISRTLGGAKKRSRRERLENVEL